eukprot:CAMPEP_0185759042 /NCGR_PEP_ID=MMETSP1174-20130828/17744_1 /TAXON_ID=35687 /ORGANISM="Dictyocha speculum, Strain CCMP1381" /LENGTH=54 /DNA_ID=CAMNT_0028439179 /DNA_START=76 /DNA_END=237 /DNA_ORIENTATION=-
MCSKHDARRLNKGVAGGGRCWTETTQHLELMRASGGGARGAACTNGMPAACACA